MHVNLFLLRLMTPPSPKCHPPLCAVREMLCNFIPTNAALTASMKPVGSRAVHGSLLFLLFTALSVITIYISKLIIWSDMYLVRVAPGNASIWHPVRPSCKATINKLKRSRSACVSVWGWRKLVWFVLIPVELSTCLGLGLHRLMHFQGLLLLVPSLCL